VSAKNLLARVALLSGPIVFAAGCEDLVINGRFEDPFACQQTYEFGNYGCARLVVIVEGPPQPWPAAYRWDTRAVPARDGTGTDLSLVPNPAPGVVSLRLIRYEQPAPGSEDTASVWVSARMLEDTRAVGVPLPVFAADSVLHVARFAPVDGRAPEDTVRLTLRKR
jgi:hypothetical protein